MTFKGFIESIQNWISGFVETQTALNGASRKLNDAKTLDELETVWKSLPRDVQAAGGVSTTYGIQKTILSAQKDGLKDPLAAFINGTLDKWVAYVQQYNNTTPENAQKVLSDLSAKAVEIFGASALIDIGLGMLPNGAGEASSTNTKELLKWVGLGAVIAAVAHDPVKIGILRPYQDNLEATFRNRRPDWKDMLKAFQQRSLSQTVITDINEITDPLMDQIEKENSENLDSYGATWGYQQSWINIMKDAETRALSFGNLGAMARLGHYDRKLSIFSLWTYGLDRRLMYPALAALEEMRDVALYKGFRSMVEPGYVQGLIDEEDVRSYWTKILVPVDVQDWAMPRLTKSREKFLEKEQKALEGKQRDLTKADWTTAYKDGTITLDDYKVKLAALGYDDSEIDIYVKLADVKKLGAPAAATKRLPLSDYELAHRNGLLTTDQVLARMEGEYTQADIDLEKQLLEINDLTSDAPAKERDLTVAENTTAYVDGLLSRDAASAAIVSLGFDATEAELLMKIADVKKGAAGVRAANLSTTESVTKERDLTLSQLTAAYVDNIIDQTTYTTDISSLGYDAAETTILLKLAQIKKKLPTVTGLKRLPLGDYEKAWKYGKLTSDQVLDRMRGEYTEDDIGLENQLLAIGKP